jgi:hypothetical protein
MYGNMMIAVDRSVVALQEQPGLWQRTVPVQHKDLLQHA